LFGIVTLEQELKAEKLLLMIKEFVEVLKE